MLQYFKFRDLSVRKPHHFDLGFPLFFNTKFENNFFVTKLFRLSSEEYTAFYQYHLNWFISRNPGLEEKFFLNVWTIVDDRIIEYLKKKVSSLNTIETLKKLREFKGTIAQLDTWNISKKIEVVVAEKDLEISALKLEINDLKNKLKSISRFDPDQKIRILEGNLPTLVDLIKQIQHIEMPDGKKLARSQSQSPWYKMIARYFQQGENEISPETLRNYFPANTSTKLVKGSEVAESNKLFKIIPLEPK
ncbi:hypothetical protein ACFOWA_18330 [Pedobacter lithocola]|uniref:Uncharacterized protein n=2 Tax=Pedobacter TaxID=84567 RepID=A0A3N0BP80_9SPHI|nr:hypothetical protein [Pedobacter jejuensis]RNL50323.1 hypothetical protein D7004_19205 [Pedobacter jejuensis]